MAFCFDYSGHKYICWLKTVVQILLITSSFKNYTRVSAVARRTLARYFSENRWRPLFSTMRAIAKNQRKIKDNLNFSKVTSKPWLIMPKIYCENLCSLWVAIYLKYMFGLCFWVKTHISKQLVGSLEFHYRLWYTYRVNVLKSASSSHVQNMIENMILTSYLN